MTQKGRVLFTKFLQAFEKGVLLFLFLLGEGGVRGHWMLIFGYEEYWKYRHIFT